MTNKLSAHIRSPKSKRYYLPIVFLFCSTCLSAQNIFSTTNIYIGENATLSTNGNVLNEGLLMNNGSISIGGNWNNRFVYQGSGKIILNGDIQQLDNNQQSIEKLEITGGGTKNVIGNLSITGGLHLDAGILSLQVPFTLTMTESANITGGSDFSFVSGSIVTRGNGYKYYPLGANSKFYPIEFVDVKGISPVVEVSVSLNYPFDITPNLKKEVYWQRKTISGTFEGSQVSIVFDPADFPNTEKLGIAVGEAVKKPIAIETDEFDVEGNKVTSRRLLKGGVYMLGEGPLPPPKEFYISTALSPNAMQDENKKVKVFGETLMDTNFTFRVFNRTGKILFETNSLTQMKDNGWDGREGSNGSMLPSGAYPYIVHGVDYTGKKMVKQGVITILH